MELWVELFSTLLAGESSHCAHDRSRRQWLLRCYSTPRAALGNRPVSHIYVQSEMHELGVGIDRVRRDRILHEALTVGPDPLHLSLVFELSLSAASRYAEVAQRLLDGQLEQHTAEQ